MPLHLRKLTFNLLKEYYDKQNEEVENQNNLINNSDIARPGIPSIPKSPQIDYTMKKAPRK